MKKIAINGLGRIGRLVLRHYMEMMPDSFTIVAANDLVPTEDLAYLIKFDSVHGKAPFQIDYGNDYIQLDGHKIKIFSEKDPSNLPWKKLDVDIVIECTGRFTKRDLAAKHLDAGARRVIISAPSKDADFMVVLGVNQNEFDPDRHFIISNASCTTNSLAPALKVLCDKFGVEKALVTTIHAYTATQGLVDRPAKKKIRGRAAAVSIIPTTTGSDIATTRVLPELEGRVRALAVRVPIPDGALTDISAVLKSEVTEEMVNNAFKEAASGYLKGILGYTEEEVVSIDIIGDTNSGIVHALSTRVIQSDTVKVQVWYDNEYGYSRRLLDLITALDL